MVPGTSKEILDFANIFADICTDKAHADPSIPEKKVVYYYLDVILSPGSIHFYTIILLTIL